MTLGSKGHGYGGRPIKYIDCFKFVEIRTKGPFINYDLGVIIFWGIPVGGSLF